MSVFDYTTGNPDNLTGGEDASMTDIQGSFVDLKEFLNSGLLEQLARGSLIVGEVRFIAVTATPQLWLPCDGAAVPRTTYADLFAAISTRHGAGDGVNTFNVPDVKGRAVVGAGAGGGLTARVEGTKWGVEAVVLSTAQMPSHGHPVSDPGHAHAFPIPYGAAGYTGGIVAGSPDFANNPGTFSATTGISIQSSGGGQGHDNTQPSIAIPAYIYAGA
jgi:microcystin-dependent protein